MGLLLLFHRIPPQAHLGSPMSQADKSRYYKALQAHGVEFTKHYREYTTEELAEAYQQLQAGLAERMPEETPYIPDDVADEDVPLPSFFGIAEPEPEPRTHAPHTEASRQVVEESKRQAAAAPVRERDPNEVAGARLNTKELDEPIRTDEHGRVWFQEEVLKPAFPKPRGRRVLDYVDTGTVQKTVGQGQFTESFEVPGTQQVASQIKITLPSYQVGLYKDPRFPFRVHTYNGNQGFNLFEVQSYYGGAELVPADIKKMYVENVLCYDVRTTIRSIQAEFRQLQLAGKVQ